MPRKTAQPSSAPATGSAVADPGGPPMDLRPGASISPEIVNVFEEGVSAGAAGLRLAPLHGRPAGEAIAVSVRAWVRNLAYDKDLWIDLCLTEHDDVLHSETLNLGYQEPAEGGGDFFTVGAAIPAPRAAMAAPTPRTVLYRLYSQMNGQVFSDGILHQHEIHTTPAKRPAPKPAAKPAVAPVEEPPAAKIAPAAPKAAAKAAVKTTPTTAPEAPKKIAPKTAPKKAPAAAGSAPAPAAPKAVAKKPPAATETPKAPAPPRKRNPKA
jgi:hypothetical protein